MHATLGMLQPLPEPERPWGDMSMDCVEGLRECEGFHDIWAVVDRLSKMLQFIPCHAAIHAVRMGKLFLREVVRLRGLPKTIGSDRGPQFASTFWGQICSRLEIE